MEAARQDVARLEEELRKAQIRLQRLSEDQMKKPVSQLLQEQDYVTEMSEGIRVTSPGLDPLYVSGHLFNLGICPLDRSILLNAKVLDLTTIMIPFVFSAPGDNIMEQTKNFLHDKWEFIQQHDMFYLPINAPLKAKGQRKVDLPNVSFAVTLLMIQKGIEFVVADPIHKGTDQTVNIINFSAVHRDLVAQRRKVQTGFSTEGGLKMTFYQRGAGSPDEKTYRAIESATRLNRSSVMHCHLTPGKYEQGLFGNNGNCYRDIKKSVAKLLNQLAILDPYTIALNNPTITQLYFVLDEFSAYAAYTAVAILGYGIKDVSSVLAFFQGVYTPMPCNVA